MTKADSFPADVILKSKQIREVGDMMTKVSVQNVSVYTLQGLLGIFKRDKEAHQIYFGNFKDVGAYKDAHGGTVIEAMDPFGLQWEIIAVSDSTDEEEAQTDHEEIEPRRRVLYRWDCGHSSPIPPKHRWVAVEGETQIISRIDYIFESSKY